MAVNPNFVPTLEPINNYTSDRIINTDKVIVEGTPSTGLVSFDAILGCKDDIALKYHYTNSPSPTSPTSSDTRYVNITNLKRTSPRILEGNDTDGNKVEIKEVTLSGTTTVKVYINGNVVENSLGSLGSRTVSLVSNTAKLQEGSATSTSGLVDYPYYSISPRELYALTVLEVLLNKENDIFSKTNSYINALIDKAFNIARLFYGKAIICRVYDGLGTGSVVPYDLLPVANYTAANMLVTCEFIYTPISGITPELSWITFDSILGLNDTIAIRYFYDDLVSSANDVTIYDTISNLKRISPRVLEGVNTNGEIITIKESTCVISSRDVPCITILRNGELYFNLVGDLRVAHPTKSYPETTELVTTKTYLLSLLTVGLDLSQDNSSTELSYKDTSPRERYTIVALKSLLELENNILDRSNAYLNGLIDKAFLISRAFLGKARMSRLDIDSLPGNAEVKDVRLVTSGNPSIVNSEGIALIPTASSTHNYGLVAIDNSTITINSSGLIQANGGISGTITDVRVNNTSVVPSGSTIANIPLVSTSNHGAMSSSDKTKLNNIESGAEVNVLSDWNLTNTSSDDYIKNKPTIPTVSIDTDDYYITVNGTSIGTEAAPIGWAWEALLAYKDEDGNFIKETYLKKITSSNKLDGSLISGTVPSATNATYSEKIGTSSGSYTYLNINTLFNDINTSITNIGTSVLNILDVIPSQATSSNKLADKDFVNSSIATNTAHYISNNGLPFTSLELLLAYTGTVTNNDYAFVTGVDSAGNTYYDRYKATVNGTTITWALEYRLNNSSFTALQWSAINSGITSGKVALIDSAILDVKIDGTSIVTSNIANITTNGLNLLLKLDSVGRIPNGLSNIVLDLYKLSHFTSSTGPSEWRTLVETLINYPKANVYIHELDLNGISYMLIYLLLVISSSLNLAIVSFITSGSKFYLYRINATVLEGQLNVELISTKEAVTSTEKTTWNNKLNTSDNSLTTTNKTIVGAINELNSLSVLANWNLTNIAANDYIKGKLPYNAKAIVKSLTLYIYSSIPIDTTKLLIARKGLWNVLQIAENTRYKKMGYRCLIPQVNTDYANLAITAELLLSSSGGFYYPDLSPLYEYLVKIKSKDTNTYVDLTTDSLLRWFILVLNSETLKYKNGNKSRWIYSTEGRSVTGFHDIYTLLFGIGIDSGKFILPFKVTVTSNFEAMQDDEDEWYIENFDRFCRLRL